MTVLNMAHRAMTMLRDEDTPMVGGDRDETKVI